MGLGIELVGVLLLAWLVGNVALVVVAMLGAGAHARRAARSEAARSRMRQPVVTLRPGAGPRIDPHGRRRPRPARLR